MMDADDIRCIAVVGRDGLMGHGIAQELRDHQAGRQTALAGYQVWLHSRTQKSLDTALDNMRRQGARPTSTA